MNRIVKIAFAAGLTGLLTSSQALACATCYGASDSPLAKGMNWGILVLLGFIGSVLTGIVVFFIHVGRTSAKLAAADAKSVQTDKLT